MNRYIEIIYDNSGSMNSHVNGRPKYEIAQELFEKAILPTIARKDDQVMLRLLGSGCHQGQSQAESLTAVFGMNRTAMLNRIRSISHDGGTPLIFTIGDAINACRNTKADEYCIFVLTDGDDTCQVDIHDLVSPDLINKYVRFYSVLFATLAVESSISRNNITAIATAMGGQNVTLDSTDGISEMKSKLKKALTVAGFSSKLPLEHCFKQLPGFDMSWDDVEEEGIDFHQAEYLYQKEMLSWEPDYNKPVSTLQFAELKFLFCLFFKTGLPEDMVWSMLKQLKKPYYYSFDCIYWDFSTARWKYFKPTPDIRRVDNPHAAQEDGLTESMTKHRWREIYEPFLVGKMQKGDRKFFITGGVKQIEMLESSGHRWMHGLKDRSSLLRLVVFY